MRHPFHIISLSILFLLFLLPAKGAHADCTCEGHQVQANVIKPWGLKELKNCEEKLYEESECVAQYGAVMTQIKRKERQNDSAIDKALSFKPSAFDFHFSAGYEFTSVNTLWSKGNPRISLGMYRSFKYAHLATQIMLTDAGEQQPVTVGAGGKISAVRALDFETLLFFPFGGWFRGKVEFYGEKRDYYWGPVALWGAKKLDANNMMLTRHYFGLRGAVGPQSYTDILLGRAENVSGTRLLLRGQMPFNFPGTDQIIYLGLEGNLSIKNRKNNPSPETIRGYLVWDIDNLLSVFGDNEKGD